VPSAFFQRFYDFDTTVANRTAQGQFENGKSAIHYLAGRSATLLSFHIGAAVSTNRRVRRRPDVPASRFGQKENESCPPLTARAGI
ncbi:hypothetical protein ACJBS6_11405, partial [Streptococcus suis]